MKRRVICILAVLCMLLSLIPTAFAISDESYSMTSDSYYDKTLAGLLGHISGFLSGYEFVWEEDGSPASPLPDEWFSLLNGPYSGNFTHAGDPNYPGYDRYWDTGIIASDDDYHVDIFNQHILAEHGPNVSYYDIKEEWKEHYVHDWGAGFMAAYLTRYADMLPPFTGMREYGNMYYWCTEPYIENDTLGMAAPGMPQKAVELAEKFGSVTGDFDGVTWAKFGAALYSLAYTENTAYDVVTAAAECLPAGSWPKTIYDTCLSLYSTEPDWREAVAAVADLKRNVAESDNVQTLTDVNNAIIILSLLYGNNDYLDSLKIAALAGYDGDCNAATVGGIMGVIHGMQGTPSTIVSDVYANGNGKYINVLPTDNPFDINLVTNPSFENDGAGTINGWGTWNGRDESGVSASFIENSGYDGAYRLTHYKNTDYEVFNGQTISNLIPGRYTLSAWVLGDDSTSHFLSIKNHGHPEQTVAIPNAPYPNWVEISIGDIDIYTGSCEIGVYSNASAGSWCSIDNVQLMLIDAY